jgi:hypothetical protein
MGLALTGRRHRFAGSDRIGLASEAALHRLRPFESRLATLFYMTYIV